MSKMSKLKPVSMAVGAAFATTLAIAPLAQASSNPFAMQQLEAGYKLADNTAKEGSCGSNKVKSLEASCGANKAKQQVPKLKEGKCGEAKCGSNKK